MEKLTLYVDRFWISPYAFTAFVSLVEKGLPFEVVEIGLDKKEHHVPFYVDGSLTGRVPALQHGDYWLSESSAIAEYLAETFPFPDHPRIFPADLRERGTARQLMAWIRSDLMPIRTERPTTSIFYEPAKDPLSPAGEKAAGHLLRVADRLISDGRTVLFGAWCIADADFGLMLQRLVRSGHPVPSKVRAYVDAQWARPSVRRFVERERPKYVAY
jgi:glutathione S-transferase